MGVRLQRWEQRSSLDVVVGLHKVIVVQPLLCQLKEVCAGEERGGCACVDVQGIGPGFGVPLAASVAEE